MPETTKSNLLRGDMLVGISAVFIGLCALAVSLYEASLMREEQRSAVLPMLELARSYYVDTENTEAVGWRLLLHAENVGIGPALVRDFVVTVDDVPQPDWRTSITSLVGTNVPIDYGQSQINGRTIPPERRVVMLDIPNDELASEILKQFDRLDFTACYCSVFDECWTTSYSRFGDSRPVEACTSAAASFRE